MSIRRCSLRVPPAAAGTRLDAVVGDWLRSALDRPPAKSAVRRLIVAGAIQVNGRQVRRPAYLLRERDRLDAVVDERRLEGTAGRDEPSPSVRALYEDDALIAVAKPALLPVHATADASRPDLYSLVLRHIGASGVSPYLGLHHRLDRDTSGIVLFTKRPEANPGLAAQFAGRQVRKVYHGLAADRPGPQPDAWQARNRLAQVGGGRNSRVEGVTEGGQAAETDFAVLGRYPGALLVEACPHTGRKHQIRAHLREHGTPLLGDARYGGPVRIAGVEVRRTMLHARSLTLRHPLTGAMLTIECEYPEDFAALLRRLRGGG